MTCALEAVLARVSVDRLAGRMRANMNQTWFGELTFQGQSCLLQEFQFRQQFVLLAELNQLVVAIQRIGPGRVDDFRMAFGAKVKWLSIRLGKAVASLHIALVFGAMLDGKHVARFVSCDFDGSQQALTECVHATLGVTKSGQRPDADTVSEGCVSEHEIPPFSGPQVGRGECNRSKCVGGKVGRKDLFKNVGSQKLMVAPCRVVSLSRIRNFAFVFRFQGLDRAIVINRKKLGAQFDQLFLFFGERANGLHIQFVSLSSQHIGTNSQVLGKRLAWFLVMGQPLTFCWLAEFMVEWCKLLYRFFDRGNTQGACGCGIVVLYSANAGWEVEGAGKGENRDDDRMWIHLPLSLNDPRLNSHAIRSCGSHQAFCNASFSLRRSSTISS